MKNPRTLVFVAVGILLILAFLGRVEPSAATAALAPVAAPANPPAGLSVEAKNAPFGKGFDFRFRSDTSSTTVTIDPLGNRHSDSGSLSSKAGSISLTAKYNPSDRTIVITAKRGGTSIGEYSWRVEAILR
jgi:di/tricarboxylate transporter